VASESDAVHVNDVGLYSSLVQFLRWSDSSLQIRALHQGLAEVLPVSVFPLFNAEELELFVCGQQMRRGSAAVQLLQRCTEFEGVAPDAPHIVWFWETLSELMDDDLERFLRFVWARSRLPHSEAELRTSKKCGEDVGELGDDARTRLRLSSIGFVYQFHHLLPEFSALDNVALPQMIAGKAKGAARERAAHLLTQLGLAQRLEHQPAQLSGGEQQRVAIARALANHPKLILADEPTGNLDPATSGAVFQSLFDLARIEGVAALIATHNLELASFMDRVVELKDGRLVEKTA
jgi:ABC-type lipoprotein export system ATPase subunit